MRVDFYLLSQDPAPAAVALLARKTREAGEKLLVVAADAEARQAIARALWESAPEAFLANGMADQPHAERQPILLADTVAPVNGASFLVLADGQWREAGEGFTRIMLLFDEANRGGARETWTMLAAREGVERRFWKQVDGRWVEGP